MVATSILGMDFTIADLINIFRNWFDEMDGNGGNVWLDYCRGSDMK